MNQSLLLFLYSLLQIHCIINQAFIIWNHKHSFISRNCRLFEQLRIVKIAVVEFISWSKCNSSIFIEDQWQIKAEIRLVFKEFNFFRRTFTSHDLISMRKVTKLFDDCQMVPINAI